MNVALAIATLVGTTASVFGVWLALRAKRRRFARELDREIRRSVWAYALACKQTGASHSLSGFSQEEIRHSLRVDGGPAFSPIQDASVEFLRESLNWRLESYRPSVPRWALSFLPPADAYRYNLEWGAHLRELIDDGHRQQARTDRRRLAMMALFLAISIRVRRPFGP
jgi:hypothetical protein